jgi:hypothetical protein
MDIILILIFRYKNCWRINRIWRLLLEPKRRHRIIYTLFPLLCYSYFRLTNNAFLYFSEQTCWNLLFLRLIFGILYKTLAMLMVRFSYFGTLIYIISLRWCRYKLADATRENETAEHHTHFSLMMLIFQNVNALWQQLLKCLSRLVIGIMICLNFIKRHCFIWRLSLNCLSLFIISGALSPIFSRWKNRDWTSMLLLIWSSFFLHALHWLVMSILGRRVSTHEFLIILRFILKTIPSLISSWVYWVITGQQ